MLPSFAAALVGSLLLALASAVPVAPVSNIGPGGDQTGASTTQGTDPVTLSNLRFMSEFASAAYCADNDNVTFATTQLQCSASTCPEVQALNISTVLRFLNSGGAGDTGFVAIDKYNKNIMVVFRGSHTTDNWLADLDFIAESTPWCKGCKIHSGFWRAWSQIRSQVIEAVTAASKLYPSYRIVTTGHSLGAALATIAAGDMRRQDSFSNIVDMYNYGSPRVGNLALATFLTAQAPNSNFRVTSTDDPVPRLPPNSLGFYHISPEYWLESNPDSPSASSDVKVLTGYYNSQGNSGTGGLDRAAHGHYFGRLSSCSKTPS